LRRLCGEQNEALDHLVDVVNQACSDSTGALDSRALSAYADALRYLALAGKVEITEEYGRRVIGRWVDQPLSRRTGP